MTADPPILEARGVSVRFGGLTALDSVNFSVAEASTTGLVGPNGAGKTTLFNVLTGLQRPNTGCVRMRGVEVTRSSPQARARRGMARTYQHPALFSDLTVREHLVLADRVRFAPRRLWLDLLTARGFRRPDRQEDHRVDQLLGVLGLTGLAHRRAVGLPLGTSRLVEVGRALAADPRVLLLDEGSSGLDEAETAELSGVLQRLVRDRGISIVLVEHDVELVFGMSDHVYVLDFGKLIAAGAPHAMRADAKVRAAYLGEHPSPDAVTAEEHVG